MSAVFDAAEQLTGTGPTISNGQWLVSAVYVKLPASLTGWGSVNYLLRFTSASHQLSITNNASPIFRIRHNYGSEATVGSLSITQSSWILLVAKAGPNDGTATVFENFVGGTSTGSGDPGNSTAFTGDNSAESMASIQLGSTAGSTDIPNGRLAEPCIFSAADETEANAIVDALLAGDDPSGITDGTLLWHRDLESDGTTGTGTGDLSGTGVSFDSGDHPSFSSPPAASSGGHILII